MGIVSTIIKHRSTIFAVASGACTLAALYFMHEETKQDIIDRPEETFIEPKDKVVYFVQHYKKTELAAIAALGFMAATKILDARTIATLSGSAAVLSSQYKNMRQAINDTVDDKTKKSIDAKALNNAIVNTKSNSQEKINVHIPYINKTFETTEYDLVQGELIANQKLRHDGHCYILDWLELIGYPTDKLGKKELRAIAEQGWFLDSDEQGYLAQNTTAMGEIWIKHILEYSPSKGCLVLYIELEPITDPEAPCEKKHFLDNVTKVFRKEHWDKNHICGRDHDENQYRFDKLV